MTLEEAKDMKEGGNSPMQHRHTSKGGKECRKALKSRGRMAISYGSEYFTIDLGFKWNGDLCVGNTQ